MTSRDPKILTEEQRTKNQTDAEHYVVRGYPTVLLLESDGTIIGRSGYVLHDQLEEMCIKVPSRCTAWTRPENLLHRP